MKKNLEKILVTASIVIAIVLIMVLLVTAFGGIPADEFDSQLVRGLLITFAAIYLALALASLIMVFISSDAVKEITVRSEQKGSVRVSIGVVRKMVKETCADIEGVKCQKVNIITDDYGVRLKIGVKMTDRDVTQTETLIRLRLEDMFKGALGFRFHTIEIKVIALKAKYQIDAAEIDEKVEQRLAEIAAAEKLKEEAEEREKLEENEFNASTEAGEAAETTTSEAQAEEAVENGAEENENNFEESTDVLSNEAEENGETAEYTTAEETEGHDSAPDNEAETDIETEDEGETEADEENNADVADVEAGTEFKDSAESEGVEIDAEEPENETESDNEQQDETKDVETEENTETEETE